MSEIDGCGEEAEKRIAQIDKGEVRLVLGEKVFLNIRKKYMSGSKIEKHGR